MTLTREVLVKIIKEELEALMDEQAVEETEVDPVDAQIADLEKQLAEAKKAKMQKAKGTKGKVANVYDKSFGKKGVKSAKAKK
jgi:regulator of replication initiation timing